MGRHTLITDWKIQHSKDFNYLQTDIVLLKYLSKPKQDFYLDTDTII